MSIRVELFGIPRRRAGVADVTLPLDGPAIRLGDVLRELVARFPPLGTECIDGERLRDGYLANVGGDRFVCDAATRLRPGDCVLILSADAGG